jgi:acetylglutamate synthase
MTNISETQNATCRKVEKHLINYSAGEVTRASSSTVMEVVNKTESVTDTDGHHFRKEQTRYKFVKEMNGD